NDGALFATKNAKSAYYAANDSVYTAGDSSLVRLICDASGTTPAWRFATDFEKDVAALCADLPEDTAVVGMINTGFVYVKEKGDWRRGTDLDMLLDFSCVDGVKNYTTYTADATDTTWYICVLDGGKLDGYTIPTSWRLAKESEADTAQFDIPETAADSIKQGHINKGRFFVYEKDEWRRGTENDYLLGKACLADMEDKVYYIDEQYYTCTKERKLQFDGVVVNNTWRDSKAEEADTFGWSAPTSGPDSVRTGNIDKTRYYVYEDGWRFGTYLDMDLGPCTSQQIDKVVKSSDDVWYKCVNGGSTLVGGKPVAREWRKATDFEVDTDSLSVTARVGTYSEGPVNKNLHYVKDSAGWRPATDLENSGLDACTKTQKDSVKSTRAGEWYKCTNDLGTTIDGFVVNYTWRKATNIERDTVGWGRNDAAEGDVKPGEINGNMVYVFETKNGIGAWRHGTSLDASLGLSCIQSRKDTLLEFSSLEWYKCVGDTNVSYEESNWTSVWRRATDLEIDMSYWNENKKENGTLLKGSFTGRIMVWDDGTLREANDVEIGWNKGCVKARYGRVDTLSSGLGHTCSDTGWSKKGTFKDDRDGKIYKGVKIGTQVWMAENLNYDYKVSIDDERVSFGHFCYDDLSSNCDKYGRLYLWSTAMDSAGTWAYGLVGRGIPNGCGYGSTCTLDHPVKGVCPHGWHLPNLADWATLYDYAGGIMKAGYTLQSTEGWTYNRGWDLYGFSVLGGGYGYADGTYSSEGTGTHFWTSVEVDSTEARIIYFANSARLNESIIRENRAAYVRCIKNNANDN
ncbi:MAG: fibrobacter succinogenes major paralogous domain-containing protein, partial [Fibrobacter sp.]|nr:fibrobacter succinogenes major paralogous domain-containing protein [Fibrobacter sp.]